MTQGDKSDLPAGFLDALASDGYAVASIDYRLAPASHFPAQVQDVKCAIRYLRAKAPKYGLDGTAVFAFGTSAGGQLVALAALVGAPSAWEAGPFRSESSSLTAVADIFGPANLTTRGDGYTSSDIQQLFGSDDHRNRVLASPAHYVHPNAPPILLIHGVDDSRVLASQSIQFDRELRSAGDEAPLILVQNMGHMFVRVGTKPMDPSPQQVERDVVIFFDSVRLRTTSRS